MNYVRCVALFSLLTACLSEGWAATFVVTNTSDYNPTGPSVSGSLRWAIDQSNGAGGSNTINFAIPSGTINLVYNLDPILTSVAINGPVGVVTINGQNSYSVFKAMSGTVSLQNFAIENGVATGGAGGSGLYGGGGGMGAGGGLYIASDAVVTATNLSFSNCQAVGGAGGNSSSATAGGGGGGFSGAGGNGVAQGGGGGGGFVGAGGNGATGSTGGGGGGQILYNGSNGSGTTGGASGDSSGGTAGQSGQSGSIYFGGGGGGGYNGTVAGNGGNGGDYGGGGGGGGDSGTAAPGGGGIGGKYGGGGGVGGNLGSTSHIGPTPDGGYGGGGGGGSGNPLASLGGYGGFGGGGGGGDGQSIFGGGSGSTNLIGGGGGGGGAGMGGAIFIEQSGQLILTTSSLTGSSVTGGAAGTGAQAGGAYGAPLFMQSGSSATFNIPSSTTVTLNGPIESNQGYQTSSFTKTGAGTLVLTGSNTYGSTTAISQGTLSLSSGSLPSDTALSVASGATYNISATTAGSTLQSLTGSGSVVLGSKTLTLQLTAPNTFDGQISGSGTLVKAGSSTLTLTGANTQSATQITEGTLALSGSGSLSSTGSVALSSGAVFSISGLASSTTIGSLTGAGGVSLGSNTLAFGSSSGTFSGVISGSGGIDKVGAGTVTLSGSNLYTGTTYISSGTLAVTGSINQTNVEMAGSYLDISANPTGLSIGNLTGSTGEVLLGNRPITLNTTGTATFNGTFSGTGTITKQGTGTQNFGADSAVYNGSIVISQGTLGLTGSGNLSSCYLVSVAAGSFFDISASTSGSSIGAISGAGTVTLGSKTLTINTIDATTFSGTISGSGSLIKSGSGTQIFSGSNTYTGTTTVTAGSLSIQSSLTGSDITVNSGASFDISQATSPTTIKSITNAGTFVLGTRTAIITSYGDITGTISGAGVLQLQTSNLTFNISGSSLLEASVTGTGSLIKSGVGTLTLSGPLYTPLNLQINAGTLAMSGAASTSAITNLIVGATGVFNLSSITNAGLTVGNLSGTTGAQIVLGSKRLTFGTPTLSTTFPGVISGTGGITKQDSGTALFSAVNTFTGTATVSAGTFGLTGSATLACPVAVDLGATFDISGVTSATTISGLTGVGTGSVTLGSKGLTLATGTTSYLTFASITGSGSITKTGSGTQTLIGTNTYTGDTTISAGNLSILGTMGQSAIQIDAGATFDISEISATPTFPGVTDDGTFILGSKTAILSSNSSITGTLSGTGTLQLQSSNLTFTLGGSSSVEASVTGTGDLIKAGVGTLTLSGSLYTPSSLQINAGTLAMSGAVSSGASTNVTVGASALFNISALTGAGLTVGDLSGTTGAQVVLGSNQLTFGTSTSSLTFPGVISGTGGITKQGSGTVLFSAVNTFTGTATIAAGTLSLTGSATLACPVAVATSAGLDISAVTSATSIGGLTGSGTGSVTLGSKGLTLSTGSTSYSSSAGISGTGTITKTGSGTQTLNGALSYSGLTTINAGTLAIGSYLPSTNVVNVNSSTAVFDISAITQPAQIIDAYGTGSVAIGTKTLHLNSATDRSLLAITGTTGSLIKDNTNTLTLTGTSTYSGDTHILSGVLQLSGAGTLSSDTIVSPGGGTFDISLTTSGATIGGLSGPGIVLLGTKNLILDGDENMSYSGSFSATAGTLTKTGTSRQILSGTNGYTGSTTVTGGQLVIQSALASGNNVVIGANGILDLSGISGSSQSLGLISGDGILKIGTKSVSLNITTNQSFATIQGTTGGVTKTGAATLTLTGTSTFQGTLAVNAGTVALSGTGVLAGDGAVAIGGSGTLDISGASVNTTIGALSGSGALVLGTKELIFGSSTTSATFSGSITGSGTINKFNSATETISGANAGFSGSVIVSSGTLAISGSGTLGTGDAFTVNDPGILDISAATTGSTIGGLSGDGGIILGSKTLTISTTAGGIFSGSITGSGALIKNGTGTQTLSGNVAYSGSTTVSAGTLETAALYSGSNVSVSSGALLDLSIVPVSQTLGDLSGGGTIEIGSANLIAGTGNSTTFGTISGSGTFTKTGSGTLLLTGTSGPFSTVTVSQGTLGLSGSGTMENNPLLVINSGATFSIAAVTTGVTLSSLTGLGTMAMGTKSLQLSISGVNQFDGDITGSGALTKTGTGTFILTGVTHHTGGTTVAAGKLQLEGATLGGNVTVQSGAFFEAGGTVTGDLTVSGQTILPVPDDLLTITGNYTQNSGSSLLLTLDAEQSALIEVGGNATISSGASLILNMSFDEYFDPTDYTFITAGGTASGLFGTIVNPYPRVQATLISTGVLHLDVVPFHNIITQGNPGKVAAYLDTLRPNPGSDLSMIYSQLLFLTTPELILALDQMDPAIYKNGLLAAQQAAISTRSAMIDHLMNIYINPCVDVECDRRFWVQGYGDFINQQGQSGINDLVGYESKTGAFVLGIDKKVTQSLLCGVGGAFSSTDARFDLASGHSKVTSYTGMLYFSFNPSAIFLNGIISAASDDFSQERKIQFATTDRRAKNEHGGLTLLGHLDGGFAIQTTTPWQLRPFGAVDYLYIHEQAMDEYNAGSLNLHVDSNSSKMVRGEAGLYLQRCFEIKTSRWLLDFKLSWAYQSRGIGDHYTSHFIGQGGAFTVVGLYPSESYFAPGASLVGFFNNDRFILSATYDGSFGAGYEEQTGRVECSICF